MTEVNRSFPRKKRRFQVRYTDPAGVSRIGFTHNLSFSGVFVIAGSLPAVGQQIDLVLRVPDGGEVHVLGNVVRQKRVPLALSNSMPTGFGLGLTGYSEEYSRFVEAL
jgi:hypothetical protein